MIDYIGSLDAPALLVFMITGAALTLAACLATWLIGEVIWAAVAAASWCRWALRVCKTRKVAVDWWSIPESFFYHWRYFLGFREGSSSTHTPGGWWKGPGNWHVAPRDGQER